MIEDTLSSENPTCVVDMVEEDQEATQAIKGIVKPIVNKVSPNTLQIQLLISIKSWLVDIGTLD